MSCAHHIPLHEQGTLRRVHVPLAAFSHALIRPVDFGHLQDGTELIFLQSGPWCLRIVESPTVVLDKIAEADKLALSAFLTT